MDRFIHSEIQEFLYEDVSKKADLKLLKTGTLATKLYEAENLSNVDLDIVANGDGVAVVLSDRSVNGMFNIGSARPTPELVKAMEKIGSVVAEHENTIEISGHTDGRKFQSADYDNWRLSSARAQMAYYMLVRGGMKETQVEKIVGEAAVRLKVPEDPYAAANRRIEVFLRLPAS